MHVYRIEDSRDRNYGPFNPQINMFQRMLQSDGVELDPSPAMKASVVARLAGKQDPMAMPGPSHDGIEFDRVQASFGGYEHAFHAAFKTLRQYHEWFKTRLVRRALLMPDGHMVMREYDVPASDVLIGGHQVMFRFDRAKVIQTLTKEQAVK